MLIRALSKTSHISRSSISLNRSTHLSSQYFSTVIFTRIEIMSNKTKTGKLDTGDEALRHIESVQDGQVEEASNVDDAILRAQGHDAAMERQFSWIAALGMAFSITNSWVGYLVCGPAHGEDVAQAKADTI